MPILLAHLGVALLFGIAFAVGSVIWDLDHFTKCQPKNLVNAALTNNKDPAYLEENASKGGCRGFTHSLAFGVGFTALWAGYIVHMIMDTNGGIGI